MKNIILILGIILMSFNVKAQEKLSKNAKYDVKVSGNCEMCKKRIEKAAFSVSGVKSAEWHMDDATLHLIINEQKCSVLDVENAIAKVGHDTQDVKATDEDYETLHTCCAYDRE